MAVYIPGDEFNQNAILKKLSTLDSNFPAWSALQDDIVTVIQTDALAADTDAQAVLSENRAFIKNTGLTNITINLGGTPFVFTAGVTYNPSPAEAAIFLQKALDVGASLFAATLTDYLATGVVQAYFE